LWRLKDAFSAQYTDRGQHPKQVIAVASHFLKLATTSARARTTDWKNRYSRFIRTHVDPLWWPEDIRDEILKEEGWSPPRWKDPHEPAPLRTEQEFSIDGEKLSRADVMMRLAQSLDEFIQTAEKLRSQNDRLYIDGVIREAFAIQSAQIKNLVEALQLWQFRQQLSRSDGRTCAIDFIVEIVGWRRNREELRMSPSCISPRESVLLGWGASGNKIPPRALRARSRSCSRVLC